MAALTEVRVPDIGDFADVPVIEVLVAVGDEVSPEDPLIVLESEKATLEVPSPAGGTVAEITVAVGDEVSQGDLILTLSADAAGPADGDQDPGQEHEAGQEQEGEPEAAAEPVAEAPARDEDRGEGLAQPRQEGLGERDPLYAGPGARRLARELGVDLAAVSGSGRRGRITREDVRAVADGGAQAPATAPEQGTAPAGPSAPAAAPVVEGLPPWPQVDFAEYGPVERVELSRIRRIAGPNLARNWVAIPHVTQHDEADITRLEQFRVEVNAEHAGEGVKVTMVALLLKAVVSSLRAFPEFNSSLDGDALVLKRYHHLGFAADTPQGLMVPVIRDVDRKGLLEIARELAELSGRAREGTIQPSEMRGGTFTISSLGGIGGSFFTPIINAPEVAILGVSRAQTRPVWIDGEFLPRLVLPLSLSYDHRVIDGAAAARFTTHLAGVLSDPLKMLL
ncbi:MAG: dihydrolipoyllysine-residue acetyltransferase [Thermoleophilia bacterium]